MSVVIRGMKMPTSCSECAFCGYYGKGDHVCDITGKEVVYELSLENRLDDCPLVELPPHGRLIDADELVADIKGQAERLWTLDAVSERDYFIERNEKFRQAMFKAWCESLFAYLDTRPAIIEREVAE